MKEYKETIFREEHIYNFDCEIRSDLKVMEELKTQIGEPHIISYYYSLSDSPVDFDIRDDSNHICSHCMWWLYRQKRDEMAEEDAFDCLCRCSTEDEEWTKQRNKDLNGIYYKKITFLPEIQNEVRKELDKYIGILSALLDKCVKEEEEEKAKIEKQRNEWKILKVYEDIKPKGDEDGRDGYFDAEYISQNGCVVRMVNRDVFDFGCYSYPKRFAGTRAVLNSELWTDEEKSLSSWISKFGEFRGTRM